MNVSNLRTTTTNFRAKTKNAKKCYFKLTAPSFILGNSKVLEVFLHSKSRSSLELFLEQLFSSVHIRSRGNSTAYTPDRARINSVDITDKEMFICFLGKRAPGA